MSAPSDPAQVAEYIADLVTELSAMAARHHLQTLWYLLDMARLEAMSIRVASAPEL